MNKLKMFVQFCSMQPHILNRPEFDFFKQFVESLGGKVPENPKKQDSGAGEAPQGKKEEPKKATVQPEESEEEDDEPELPEPEIDREGCVEPDPDTPHEMGDITKQPSEDDIDKANELRSKAQSLYSEQKFDEAIDLYTQVCLSFISLALF